MLKASAILASLVVIVSSISPALAQRADSDLTAQMTEYRQAIKELESLRARATFARRIRTFVVVGGIGASAYQFLKGANLLKRAKAFKEEGNLDMNRVFSRSGSTELTRGGLYIAGTGSVVYINNQAIQSLDEMIAKEQSKLRDLESALGDMHQMGETIINTNQN